MAKAPRYEIIDTAAACTVAVFMQAFYENKLRSLIIKGKPSLKVLDEACIKIYNEYLDLSGLIASEAFELMIVIYFLDCRSKRIRLLVHVQRESIDKIGMPCIGAFEKLFEYGHKLKWDKDKPDVPRFLKQLQRIEEKEKLYQDEMEDNQKELAKLNNEAASSTASDRRRNFIRQLNILRKSEWEIINTVTTMEDLGIIVSEHMKAIEEMKFKTS